MNQSKRVKMIREYLGYTQKEFGTKIDVGQTYLSQIEKGDRPLTEKIIKLICFEFNVNYAWLVDGIGEMFIESNDSLLDGLAKKHKLRDIDMQFIEAFIKLDETDREALYNFAKSIYLLSKNDE